MLDQKQINSNKQWLKSLNQSIKQHSDWCRIMSDPTRAKILLLLNKQKKLCVTDIAKILQVSVSGVSHQLDFLERSQIVGSQKTGKIVCYFIKGKNNRICTCLKIK